MVLVIILDKYHGCCLLVLSSVCFLWLDVCCATLNAATIYIKWYQSRLRMCVEDKRD